MRQFSGNYSATAQGMKDLGARRVSRDVRKPMRGRGGGVRELSRGCDKLEDSRKYCDNRQESHESRDKPTFGGFLFKNRDTSRRSWPKHDGFPDTSNVTLEGPPRNLSRDS